MGDSRFEEAPLSQIKEGEVLVKVRACGICSLDIVRIMEKCTYSFPLIPGHEPSGEIAQLKGSSSTLQEKTPLEEGERVTAVALILCYRCPHCQVGEFNC